MKFLQQILMLQVLAHTGRQMNVLPPNDDFTLLNYQDGPPPDYQNNPSLNYHNSQPANYQNGPLLNYHNGLPLIYQNGPPPNDPNVQPQNYQNSPPLNYQNGPPLSYLNYQDGPPLNYHNDPIPNDLNGPPSNYQNGLPPNYQNGLPPNDQNGRLPYDQNGPPPYYQNAGPLRSQTKVSTPKTKTAPPTRHYDPNYGFKEYWPGGDWVLYTTPPADLDKTTTTKKMPKVCGKPCPLPFHDVAEVCGRWNTNYGVGDSCPFSWDDAPIGWIDWGWSFIFNRPEYATPCTNFDPDDYTKEFETFDSYCSFLRMDCKTRIEFKNGTRLVFVHVGKCKDQKDYFLPMREDNMTSRLDGYLQKVKERFKKWNRTWSP